jgi:TFIIH basal transcription factor complex TTD-A subunit
MPPKQRVNSPKPSSKKRPASADSDDLPTPAGLLISCDIPTKQYIQYLNEVKPADKKFIVMDLDATHLLVKHKAKAEIEQKVEEWLDENVFSAVERVGEDISTV